MRTKARDRDAIVRMRAANSVSTPALHASLSQDELRRAMDAAIAAGESSVRPKLSRTASVRRRPLAAFAGLACGAAVALIVLLAGAPGGGSEPEFAAAALRVAEANPRLLVTEPGWSITRADEFEADEGEVTFSDGMHELGLTWYPARLYRSYLRDREDVGPMATSTLLGKTATTVHYGGSDYATMLSPMGSVFLEVRGGFDGGDLESHAEYEALLHSLRPVDVSTWLEAMPPSVVRPKERPHIVERMLKGVPLPPGFDPTALQREDVVSEPYELAADVGDAVSCGWVESWLAARKAGDDARAQVAVDALATAKHWPLMDILRNGGWAGNILSVAHELQRGHLDNGPVGSLEWGEGEGYEMGPSWAMAIECEDHIWRRPLGSASP